MKTNLIFLFLVFASVIGSAQTLTLKVEGIENVKGYLYIGIYNSPESFMKKPVFGFRVPVQDSVMVVPCQGLPVRMPFHCFRMRMRMEYWIPALSDVRRRSLASAIMLKV